MCPQPVVVLDYELSFGYTITKCMNDMSHDCSNMQEGFQGIFVEHRLRDILECLITECQSNGSSKTRYLFETLP